MGWIEYGEGEEMVGVLGHVDIVPLGEGWNYDPLGCEVHDGKMFGRGVLDDKVTDNRCDLCNESH